MDREEDIYRDREGDRLGDEGDRLGDRDLHAQRVSEADSEKEMSALVREYDMGNSDGEVERSPPKLELIAQHYREYIKQASLSPPVRRTLPTPPVTPPLPISTMDISSFQPVPVQAQAAIASAHGHPRMIWPVRPKFNNICVISLIYPVVQSINSLYINAVAGYSVPSMCFTYSVNAYGTSY